MSFGAASGLTFGFGRPFLLQGFPPLGPGEGITWRLHYEWAWSLGATVLLLVLLEAIFLLLYLRERSATGFLPRFGLAQLRFLSLGIILFMTSRATLSFFRTGLPYLPIVVDDSLSMTTVDVYDSATEELLKRRLLFAEDETLSRWRIVQKLFSSTGGQWLDRLHRSYRPRVHLLSHSSQIQGLENSAARTPIVNGQPSAPTTELGNTVRRLLDHYAGTPPAAIVLVTDGINTDGPGLDDAARWARARQVPLFFVAVGEETAAPDIEVRDLIVEDPLFVGDLAVFSCTVETRGFKGEKLAVTLREQGSPQPLQTVSVTPTEERFQQTVRLSYRPTRVGQYRFRVEIEPRPQERDPHNNSVERPVTVTDEKIRVLLAAAGPSYEYRFLHSLLTRERTVELRSFLQEADLGHAEQDPTALPAFPVRREDLAWFDVIILIDVDPTLLGNVVLENLAAYVDPPSARQTETAPPAEAARPGSLIIVAGPRNIPARLVRTPLERLLPVDIVASRVWEAADQLAAGYRPRPTPLGYSFPGLMLADSPAENEALWERLPPFYWCAVLGSPKPGARVLLEHPQLRGADGQPMPLAAFHYVGQGIVLVHGFDETWRWRWRVGDIFFARYWLQTLRFLARGRLGTRDKRPLLATDRRQYHFGEPVTLRLQFPEGATLPIGETVTILVRAGEDQPQAVTLSRSGQAFGIFEGVLTQPQAGSYQAWYPQPGSPEQAVFAQFRVLPPATEFARLEADIQGMRQAAERTGGLLLRPWEVGLLPEVLPQGQSLPTEALPSRPIWNWWPVVLLVVLLLSAEWILRKFLGLA